MCALITELSTGKVEPIKKLCFPGSCSCCSFKSSDSGIVGLCFVVAPTVCAILVLQTSCLKSLHTPGQFFFQKIDCFNFLIFCSTSYYNQNNAK